MENKKFEVVVIGSGPGGYAAAFRAADLGKKVLLVDKDNDLGGVCLNRGCIPSKTLLHVSKIIYEAKELKKTGVSFGQPEIDLKTLREYKNKIIKKLSNGIKQLAKARNVETAQGLASFVSNSEISVFGEKDSFLATFDNCIIATGSSSSSLPFIKNPHPKILTSKTALELKEIPDSLLVVGGGIIGLELGQVYSALGSKVDLVEFLPNIASGADKDLIKPLQRVLKTQFRSIMVSSKVLNIDTSSTNELSVIIEGEIKESKTYSAVLLAVGRTPNLDMLKIKNTAVNTNKEGFITVDNQQRTSVDNIFAIGDIVGNPMLAHKSTHEGKVAAEVVSGLPTVFDRMVIPSVIYTDPEVAWVGITEEEAKEKNIKYNKGEFPWAASGRAISVGSAYGKTKLLFNKKTKRIIGGGIVGTGAGDLISEIALAIELGADAEDIGLTIHPHPTMSETISGAAEVFEGTITDLYLPRK